jgi:hypothetical protein
MSIKIMISPKIMQPKGKTNNFPEGTKIVITEIIPNPTKEKIMIELTSGTSLYLLFFIITNVTKPNRIVNI